MTPFCTREYFDIIFYAFILTGTSRLRYDYVISEFQWSSVDRNPIQSLGPSDCKYFGNRCVRFKARSDPSYEESTPSTHFEPPKPIESGLQSVSLLGFKVAF